MRVEEVHVTRKFNLGNYENIMVHLEATVDVQELPKQVIRRLEALINDWWKSRQGETQQ